MKVALIAFWVALSASCAVAFNSSPAGGKALDLRGKQGYYYAEDINDCFDDDFLKNGFTIEFWFRPERPVKKAEAWNLIAKLPIYQIEVVYFGFLDQEGMCLRYSIPCGQTTMGFFDLSEAKDYEPEWHHYIFQGQVSGNWFSGITFLDGVSGGSFSGSSSPDFVTDSDDPLYIGGLIPGSKTFVFVDAEHIMTDPTTFDGLIDEIRISSIQRYEQKVPGDKIRVPGRFKPDEHTVALWHFDENSFLEYKDASGNGHTLFASKELSVTPKASITTLWGKIKK